MGIAQNGRSIQRLVYVDENRVPHIILTAYLGDQLVWDGHVSQVLQVPRARSTSLAYAPAVLADSVVAIPVARSYSEALVPVVTGGVTIAPPVALSTSEAYAPTLFADQLIDVPVAQSYSQAYAPDIRVVFGVTPPVAISTSEAYAPAIHADATVAPPLAQSYSQAYAPAVGSYAIVNVPVALSTSQAYAPVMHADQMIVVPRATSTSQAYAPVMHSDQTIVVPAATSTSQAYAPQILSSGPTFEAYVGAYGTNSDGTASITASAGATLLIFTDTSATTGQTCTVDGHSATLLGGITNGIQAWTYSVPTGGSHTVVYHGGSAFRNFAAASYTGVTSVGTVGTGSGTSTGPTISPSGSGLVCVGGFAGNGAQTASAGTGSTIRGQLAGDPSFRQYSLAIADRTATPVSLSAGSSFAWQAAGVWLS